MHDLVQHYNVDSKVRCTSIITPTQKKRGLRNVTLARLSRQHAAERRRLTWHLSQPQRHRETHRYHTVAQTASRRWRLWTRHTATAMSEDTSNAITQKWVSSFLTAHQHILGYSVPFIHSVLFTVW